MKILISILFLSISFLSSVYADDVAVTVYNQDLALVKEGRTLEFSKGINHLSLSDVAARIDPTSVHFKLKSGSGRVELLEQDYQYDLVSTDKILQKYLGNQINIILKNGDALIGKYLSSSSGYLVLQLADGGVRMVNAGQVLSLTAPKLPQGLIIKPTLDWLADSDVAGQREAEISYLTGGIDWHAEYIGLLDTYDKNLRLSAWISLDNRSGKTYRDAKLKLVAGNINRVLPQRPVYDRMEALAAKSPRTFQEKSFFEYHLYTLGRKTTIANNATKQVSLFAPASTPVTKLYRYTAVPGNKAVNVIIRFRNSRANGLGMPLPAGKVRLTRLDSDGSEEFLGEDKIDHTPRDEEVELLAGDAFDIVGETTRTDFKRISNRVQEITMQVKLRNHKRKAVTVKVRYQTGGDWEIQDNNFAYVKKSASLAEFTVPVAVDEEVVLHFRVRLKI